jgi:hypothetical protein
LPWFAVKTPACQQTAIPAASQVTEPQRVIKNELATSETDDEKA